MLYFKPLLGDNNYNQSIYGVGLWGLTLHYDNNGVETPVWDSSATPAENVAKVIKELRKTVKNISATISQLHTVLIINGIEYDNSEIVLDYHQLPRQNISLSPYMRGNTATPGGNLYFNTWVQNNLPMVLEIDMARIMTISEAITYLSNTLNDAILTLSLLNGITNEEE